MKKYVLKDKELRNFIHTLTGIDVGFNEKVAAGLEASHRGLLEYFEEEGPTDAPVRDILSRLPHPYREKALANREKQIKEGLAAGLLKEGMVPQFTSQDFILSVAFVWGETPEGGEYWRDLAKSYELRK